MYAPRASVAVNTQGFVWEFLIFSFNHRPILMELFQRQRCGSGVACLSASPSAKISF